LIERFNEREIQHDTIERNSTKQRPQQLTGILGSTIDSGHGLHRPLARMVVTILESIPLVLVGVVGVQRVIVEGHRASPSGEKARCQHGLEQLVAIIGRLFE